MNYVLAFCHLRTLLSQTWCICGACCLLLSLTLSFAPINMTFSACLDTFPLCHSKTDRTRERWVIIFPWFTMSVPTYNTTQWLLSRSLADTFIGVGCGEVRGIFGFQHAAWWNVTVYEHWLLQLCVWPFVSCHNTIKNRFCSFSTTPLSKCIKAATSPEQTEKPFSMLLKQRRILMTYIIYY